MQEYEKRICCNVELALWSRTNPPSYTRHRKKSWLPKHRHGLAIDGYENFLTNWVRNPFIPFSLLTQALYTLMLFGHESTKGRRFHLKSLAAETFNFAQNWLFFYFVWWNTRSCCYWKNCETSSMTVDSLDVALRTWIFYLFIILKNIFTIFLTLILQFGF